jgi:hypothetical protein
MKFDLSRSEAERVVDLLETSMQMTAEDRQLAADLRGSFGMSPYPAGTCRPRVAVDGDI